MVDIGGLDVCVGLHISEICDTGFSGDDHNHCAHFVSHVLHFRFGTTCRAMVSGRAGHPASIRVHEVFARCPEVGTWESLPATTAAGLVFITNASGVRLVGRRMANVPKKHVGIFCGPSRTIYHYSNRLRKVVRATPAEFALHYPAPHDAMFFGTIPAAP